MKFLSVCCGGGGIDEGLKQAGFKTTLAVDFDPKRPNYSKDCLETIKLNHPNTETLLGSILDHEDSFGKFDCVVGGPPCPEFSMANHDATFDDTLVKCFWRIVQKTKAKYWIMENVPQVIKVCKLRNFLLNCANYGTPQRRVRRFYTNLKLPIETHSLMPHDNLFGEPIHKWISIKEALHITKINSDFLLADLVKRNLLIFEDKHKPMRWDQAATTIGAKDRSQSDYITDGVNAIKLSNRDLALLQGFPADYKFFGNKTSIHRQIGNAVPPQPIMEMLKSIN